MKQPVNTTTSGYLVLFGLFLILLGVMGHLTHPEKAHTALIAGGGFGAVCILWGILGAKGLSWIRPAALLTTVLLSAASAWRAGLSWVAVAGGQTEKLFTTLVLTLMLAVSATLLFVLLKDRPSSAERPAGGAS